MAGLEINATKTTRAQKGQETSSQNIEQTKKDLKKRGIYKVGVSGGEKGLFAIAQKFGMSLSAFKNLTGLTKDTLKLDQEIGNIPHKEITSGLMAFARSIGIDPTKDKEAYKALLALNGIEDANSYNPKKGEHLYVFPKGSKFYKSTNNNTSSTNTPQRTQSTENAESNKPRAVQTTQPQNKPSKEPELSIAEQLEQKADDLSGAVGKKEFDDVFNKLNSNNIITEWKKYKKKYDNSLLFLVSDEWSSSENARKSAMTKIYDLVAENKKITSAKNKKLFTEELNDQFDSWGRVSTKKLDEIIENLIDDKLTIEGNSTSSGHDATKPPVNDKNGYKHINTSSTHFSNKAYANEVFPTTNGGISSDITPGTITTIKDRQGNNVTAGTLKNWAINSAKNDPGFSAVKNPTIKRPLPNYNTETKKIEAVTEILHPTSGGSLNNKVVILNPGHGGYQQNNGYFDAGTVLSVKNAEGKEMPIEEWRVAQSFTEKLADDLRSRGATVVIVSGAVRNGGMAKQKYIENLLAGNKGCKEIRNLMNSTSKSNMLFLSVHVESAKEKPKNKQCSVKPSSAKDKTLATNIQKRVQEGFRSLTPAIVESNLYVNNAAAGIPSSLLEIGNIANKEITNSLLSNYDQKKYMKCIANAIEDTMLNRK